VDARILWRITIDSHDRPFSSPKGSEKRFKKKDSEKMTYQLPYFQIMRINYCQAENAGHQKKEMTCNAGLND